MMNTDDDTRAWSRHIIAARPPNGFWAALDRQPHRRRNRHVTAPGPQVRPWWTLSLTRWPGSQEPLLVAHLTGWGDLGVEVDEFARRWGLATWTADADSVEIPDITASCLFVDAHTVRLATGNWTWAWGPRPRTWLPEQHCTFGLSTWPARPGADVGSDFFAACDAGDAYIGDLTAIDCF